MTLGNYLEDFTVGDVYQHPLGRTISEADNTWFTLLTMNTNQNHFNAHFAGRAPYGRLIVNSGLSVAIVLGLSVSDMSQNAIMNLGWEEIRLTAPVFVGDTLYAESIVLATRAVRVAPLRRHRHLSHPRSQPGRRRGHVLAAQRHGVPPGRPPRQVALPRREDRCR